MPKQDTMKSEEEGTIRIILLKFMMFSFCMVSTNLLSCYWPPSLCILQQFTNCLFCTFLISADIFINYLLNFWNFIHYLLHFVMYNSHEEYRIYNWQVIKPLNKGFIFESYDIRSKFYVTFSNWILNSSFSEYVIV